MTEPGTGIGVVIVTYNAEDEITACLESLMAARAASPGGLHVVVVDNASTDGTAAAIRAWAAGDRAPGLPEAMPFALDPVSKPLKLAEGGPDLAPDPSAAVTLIASGANRGYAGGANIGLAHLARMPAVGHFWVLNPDSMVPAASVSALCAQLANTPHYGLMGGRVLYLHRPEKIQIDGGKLNIWTGVSANLNVRRRHAETPPPDPAALDFIAGTSMVASRAFYDSAGPMVEDYFLYYEEVDWALRRGDLPLAYCPELIVYHWGGTAIGSPVLGRTASPFSLYFKHRARMRFLRRFNPWALPVGLAYSLGQAARFLGRGDGQAAWTVVTAAAGGPVPRAVRDRLDPAAQAHAFAPRAALRRERPAVTT